ncbi:2'-deoxynucleoside 5'-phosphate N-hydrolase 1 [Myotis lucifugus]|uniref:2'-deoxynucleoside 5'-phosphate N-hydrolase 1 n=1 Tax=Myotis lucifugus TaxID=59463 RepID=UPI0003C4C659|nr:2'-deoxynucleoside 5'-phosphate N-hydrolase 1 [Myotis lucifugus]
MIGAFSSFLEHFLQRFPGKLGRGCQPLDAAGTALRLHCRPPLRSGWDLRVLLRAAGSFSFSPVLRGGEQPAEGDRFIHERDLALLQRADLIVAEVTQPSLGVGYEVGRAMALNKRILCLSRLESGRVLSAMIRGAADGCRFQVWDYEVGEVEVMLDRYFAANPLEQVASSLDPTT